MRLLSRDTNGELVLRGFDSNNLPAYAILSHTWDTDNSNEVSFQDLEAGTAKSKAGYGKILFCQRQADVDGLRYFWVDTCCIDKSSSAELQEAITSMFRWYHDAARCYVYLSDVSVSCDLDSPFNQFPWESAFRGSRWFTRGWTLQELLAPASVEFFSKEGKRLGDKRSLERQICETTGIAITALHGTPLSQFSVAERFKWANNRQTAREEDWAYSLLGIFDIAMPLIYGERKEKAIIRLRKEIDEASKLFAGLPSAEGAAFDSYADELDARCHPDTRTDLLRQIREWAESPAGKRIFWLNGMAGTGKSTISRTVAQSFADRGQLGASFFFKRGEGERGNASRLFTTITNQLMRVVPGMIPFVRNTISKQPEIIAKPLEEQFKRLVFQPLSQLDRASILVLVIDALDECDGDRRIREILHLLVKMRDLTTVHMRVFLTSRPELPIRLGFSNMSPDEHKDIVLQDIPRATIEHDISAFLKDEFAKIKSDYNLACSQESLLSSDWPDDRSIQSLTKLAIPLFIYAATICRFVGDRWKWNPNRRLATVLECRTTGQTSQLDQTYLPVLKQLEAGRSGWEMEELGREFTKIIGSIVVLADPLPTSSLASLLSIPKEDVDGSLHYLHSVLSVPSDPNSPVRLLHLSFREFLVDSRKEKGGFWFWVDEKKTHGIITSRSLEVLSTCLKENICSLGFPGKLRREISTRAVDECLLPYIQYSCRYWVHHLEQSGGCIVDEDTVHAFLREHFLHWLEALSLMGKISDCISLINTLCSLVDVSCSAFHTTYTTFRVLI